MRERKFDRTLVRRMKWVHGQAGGIVRMMNQNRPFNEVLIQLLAVKGAIETLIYPHLDNELRSDLLTRITVLANARNLKTETVAHLDEIRKRLASCTTREIPKLYYDVRIIEDKTITVNRKQ